MLKNVSPLLSPELLYTLAAMGHGDDLVLADGNFPADSHAERIVRADGHSVSTMLDAILQLLPLDTFVDAPASVMQPVDEARAEPPVWADFRDILAAREGREIRMERLERFAFYERARKAYAIVATSETALYGNLILKKGVVEL